MEKNLKAICVKQPWADAIIYGGKDVENRTWKTKYRGPLLIVASLGYDKKAPDFVHDICRTDIENMGGIIGIVDLVDVVDKKRDDFDAWFQGPFGFILKNPRPLKFQNIKGKLNIFDVEMENTDDKKILAGN